MLGRCTAFKECLAHGASESEVILEKPRRVKDQDYIDFVKSRPCLLLGKFDHVCSGPIDPNHITPRMGGKVGSKTDDKRALPFCRSLHDVYHILGSIEAFEARYPVILEYEIIRLQRAYRAPKKATREKQPQVVRIEVFCACKRTHKLTPGKFNSGSWNCPVLRQRVSIA
jgi:hypothetical protein